MRCIFVVWFFLLIPPFVNGVTYNPWFGNSLEIDTCTSYSYITFHSVDVNGNKRSVSGDSHIFDIGASLAYEPWCGEVVLGFSNNKHQLIGFDHAELTARYLWFDDIVGDFATLTTGLTGRFISYNALKDMNTIYHGKEEIEIHLGLGREQSCKSVWLSRFWSVYGFGFADRGRPWMFFNGSYEKNWVDCYMLGALFQSRLGFGSRKIFPKEFRGYGRVQYRIIDLGVKGHLFNLLPYVDFGAKYLFRVYAYNAPCYAHQLELSLSYPLGF